MTFRCQVCFDDVGAHEAVTLHACAHRCCQRCLGRYLHVQIADGRLAPTCFHVVGESSTTCSGVISDAEIERVVPQETMSKLRRFRFFARYPDSGAQCPHCEHLQVVERSSQRRECSCESCGRAFCFTHGLAHVGRSCAEHEARLKSLESKSSQTIEQVTKRCPGCHVAIEKNGGCNHMICLRCGQSFCWLCLVAVDEVSTANHFQSFVPGGCTQLRAEGNNDYIRFLLLMLFKAAVTLLALMITALLTVVTCGWYTLIKSHRVTFPTACTGCFQITALAVSVVLEYLIDNKERIRR